MSPQEVNLAFAARLKHLMTGAPEPGLDDDMVLAVGFLLGAGLPNAAAAVAYSAECTDRENLWPWSSRR